MNSKEERLIEIINSGLKGEEIKLNNDENITELLKLAQFQGISGLIGSFLYPYLDNEKKQLWKNAIYSTTQKQIVLAHEFEQLIKYIEQKEIICLVYKGMVIQKYYPDPTLRLMGDIDLLIDQKNLNIVDEYFRESLYEILPPKDNHNVYTKKPFIMFEVHSELFATEEKRFNEIFNHDKCFVPYQDYRFLKTLKMEYHLVYLILHIYQHLSHGGAGIRNYLDIYLMYETEKNNLDLKIVEELFCKLNLEKFYHTVMGFTNKAFGADWNFIIDDTLYQQFLNFSLSDNVYGNMSDDKSIIVNYTAKNVSKFRFIITRLFPPFVVMKDHYPSLKHRIFLPFYWIIRLVTRLILRPHKWKKKFRILSIDERNQEIKKFLYDIGVTKEE